MTMTSAQLFWLLGILLPVLGYLYYKIESAKLARTFSWLGISRANHLVIDSIEDCLKNGGNREILANFFYKVRFIDFFVKKVIPAFLFLSLLVVMVLVFDKGEDLRFRVPANKSVLSVSLQASNSVGARELEKGELVYRSARGDYFVFAKETGGDVLRFSDKEVTVVSSVLLLVGVGVLLMITLLYAYFLALKVSEETRAFLDNEIENHETQKTETQMALDDLAAHDFEKQRNAREKALRKKLSMIEDRLAMLRKVKDQQPA